MNKRTFKIATYAGLVAGGIGTSLFLGDIDRAFAAESSLEGLVTEDVLQVRVELDNDQLIDAQISEGSKVTIYENKDGWFNISSGNVRGWVSGKYVKVVTPTEKVDETNIQDNETTSVALNKEAIVTTESLKVKMNLEDNSEVIDEITSGYLVTIIEEQSDSYKVSFDNKVGWINKGSTSFIEELTNETIEKLTINATSVEVWKGPSKENAVLGEVIKGKEIEILGVWNDWYYIKCDNIIGWINQQELVNTEEDTKPGAELTPEEDTKPGAELTPEEDTKPGAELTPEEDTTPKAELTPEVDSTPKVEATIEPVQQTKNNEVRTTQKMATLSAVTVNYKVINKGFVSSTTLNVRTEPSLNSNRLGKLVVGQAIEIVEERNGWYRIKFENGTGWVSGGYGVVLESDFNSGKKIVNAIVGSRTLNVRTGPSLENKSVTKLHGGNKIEVLDTWMGWHKIKFGSVEGWVSGDYVKVLMDTIDPNAKGYVSSSTLNVRTGPGLSNVRVGKLRRGDTVAILDTDNGWNWIETNSLRGWVLADFGITKETTFNQTVMVEALVNSRTLNVRVGPSLSNEQVSKLYRGNKVQVLDSWMGWYKVKHGDVTGWISGEYVNFITDSAISKSTGIVTATNTLNVRSGPSLNDIQIGKISRGDSILILQTKNGWHWITNGVLEGWVSGEYVKQESEFNQDVKSKAKVDSSYSLNVRSGPSLNNDRILKLYNGDIIDVLDSWNGWYLIKSGDKKGWVTSDLIELIRIGKVDATTLNVRKGPSTSYNKVGALTNGAKVHILEETNGWYKIESGSIQGWVSSQYIILDSIGGSNGLVNKVYDNYNKTLEQITEIQMAVKPQTDKKYNTYIREDGLVINSNGTSGTVRGDNWNIRGGIGTGYWVVSTADKGDVLPILSKVEGKDGYTWYQVDVGKTWVNASPEDVSYYLNPNNFIDDPVKSLQFLSLSETAHLDVDEVNEKILKGKGILEGTAAYFVEAGEKYGINEIYLISHALLETGHGKSQLATGVQINGKTVYNMYGIGAYDGSALASGAEYAYNAGWTSVKAAIIGGAEFIAKGYINAGQDTLYKMRWNPQFSATHGYASHQYATDIGWAVKQVNQIYNLYSLLDTYSMTLEIPNYNN